MARNIPGPPAGPSPGEHPDVADQRAADPAEADQPLGAAAAAPTAAARAVAAAEGPQPWPRPGKPRNLLYVTLPGCSGALIVGCLSFTPSLLPRGGIIQGVVFGITAAIGYGLGVLAASVWRALPTFRSPPAFQPATAIRTRPSTSMGGMPSCGPPARPPRPWPTSERSSRTAGNRVPVRCVSRPAAGDPIRGPGVRPRTVPQPARLVDREPGDGEREAVGRDVRYDRGDQAPGSQPEPAKGETGNEGNRNRAQHHQYLSADAG